MNIGPNEIGEIVASVWATMLGGELFALPGSIELEGELISGEIHMRGEDGFEGLVRIVASLPVAQAAARVMFTTDTPDDRDATDTIAELINMIGGNIKSLIAENAQLDLPQVSRERPDTAPDAAAIARADADFVSGGHPFRVTLLRMR